ncbi:uncharacterized protein TNIN_445571 [Trichonephila inaurata madagascariensis]|uniref:ENPP1-3/EXOG-like endonuclease/phosphodiesterase domain-containing protein n=1 Tax=Trichonephila inaurata madagascariensis TaxID=2747483 RepID=A0A8X7BW15_9ARAC|nr:uncharacterized protein TNIN_445571 [Trichonephila inaurata madagascariensis]
MQVILMYYGCWQFIIQTKPEEPDEGATYKEKLDLQLRKDRCYTLIYANISLDLKNLITETTDGVVAWKILKDHFEPVTRARVIQLLDEFFGTRYQPGEDVGIFISRVKTAEIRLQEAGHKLDDLYIGFQLIRWHPQEFQSTVQQIYRWKEEDFRAVKIESELILEANRLQLMKQDLEKAENAYLSSFTSKKSKTFPGATAAAHGDLSGKKDYQKKDVKFIDPKVNAEEVQALHLPFGVPYSAQGNNSLLLLHNADYIVAYSTSLRVAEWVGFALASKYQSSNRSSPESEICWTDDARVPSDALIKCTDYNWTLVEGQNFSQRPFYHPAMLNSSEGAQSTFVTNSVPKSFLHLPLEESMTQILDEWTSRGKALHVFTGPAFDFLGTGLRPELEALQHRNESLLIPTHLFYVVTWCQDEVENIMDCGPRDLRVCSFLLPNWPFPMNCESAEKTIKKNVARAVDVEELTGLSLYPSLPTYEAVRLRTALPETPFPL